jgi:hypothetical protein
VSHLTAKRRKERLVANGGGNGGTLIRIFICHKNLTESYSAGLPGSLLHKHFLFNPKTLVSLQAVVTRAMYGPDCFDSISSHYLRCVPARAGPEGVMKPGAEGSKNTGEPEQEEKRFVITYK